jgi:hypothetical protein
MNAVTIFLLRAKSWQIFALVIGLGVSGQIVAAISLIRSMEGPDELLKVPLGFGIETVLIMCCFLGWHWSVGTFLSSRVPSALRLKFGFFRFALVYPVIYVMIFMWMFKTLNGASFSLILLLHFLAMFCLFYLLYFVSKSLVLAETCKPASFNDYAGPFFLIWFFPIGIWFIQPRLNRQYTESLGATRLP